MKVLIISIAIMFIISALAFAASSQATSDIINSLHEKALELKNEGKYAEAESMFKKILLADPSNPNANFDLGNVYLFQKKYNEALNCYNKAKELGLDDKFTADYYSSLSMAYAGMGNTKKAIYCLNQCLKINPDYPNGKDLLDLYRGGGKFEIEPAGE